MTNWETCTAIESVPGRLSEAWVFTGTRVSLSARFENLENGGAKEQFLDWFGGVEEWKVRAVLEHAAKSLKVSVQPRR